MSHHRDLNDIDLQDCSLTIGSFDGVHVGHQDLIRRMLEGSRSPYVVISFFPHPSVVLRKRSPAFYLTDPDYKADLLLELGVDHVVTQEFDLALSKIEAPDFLDLLKRQLGFRDLWAGEDFALGHDRKGNRHYLEQVSQERGFRLHVVPPFLMEGEVVSSTRIREALRSGDVARAATYLGRPFRLSGQVVQGAGRGAQLGIPTANLRFWDEQAFPARGVYACIADVQGQPWPAVTNIGFRPTFENVGESPTIEAHILDFEGDLFDRDLTLLFFDRLRDERRFSGPDELLKQIDRDIARARHLLGPVLETGA